MYIRMDLWNELVDNATTFEAWRVIVCHMFDDDKINLGRLQILHEYTNDVIKNLQNKEDNSDIDIVDRESEKIRIHYRNKILNIGQL